MYERLINFCDDAGTKDALQFLMTRQIKRPAGIRLRTSDAGLDRTSNSSPKSPMISAGRARAHLIWSVPSRKRAGSTNRGRGGYYPTPRWLILARTVADAEPLPEAAYALLLAK